MAFQIDIFVDCIIIEVFVVNLVLQQPLFICFIKYIKDSQRVLDAAAFKEITNYWYCYKSLNFLYHA